MVNGPMWEEYSRQQSEPGCDCRSSLSVLKKKEKKKLHLEIIGKMYTEQTKSHQEDS